MNDLSQGNVLQWYFILLLHSHFRHSDCQRSPIMYISWYLYVYILIHHLDPFSIHQIQPQNAQFLFLSRASTDNDRHRNGEIVYFDIVMASSVVCVSGNGIHTCHTNCYRCCCCCYCCCIRSLSSCI